MNEGQELATRPEGGGQIVSSSDALSNTAQMLAMIRDLALDPNVNAEKFKTIAEVAERQQDRMQKQQFYEAKASAILEMPIIDKRGKILILDKHDPTNLAKARTQGTFAKWPDLQRAVYPVLAKYGLIITHKIGHSESMTLVTPVLQHRNGYVEEGDAMKLPLDTSGGKNNTQGAASAATYGQRHSTVHMLAIQLQNSDDDGGLMALPDEPLNDQQARLVAVAEARAAEGLGVYEAWFNKIEPRDRAWLIQTKRDDELRDGVVRNVDAQADAPRESERAREVPREETRQQRPADPEPELEQQPDPDTMKRAAPAAKAAIIHDINTAPGWAAQYVDDMAAAESIADVDRIKSKGARGLARLADGNQALWDKCDAAELEARDRLKGGNLL